MKQIQETRIPFRISLLPKRRLSVKYIIVHHTVCLYPAPSARVDNPKYQLKGIANNVLEKKAPDINYHFIIDRIGEDFNPIMCRPFVTLCDFPDIHPDVNKRAIHVAVLGNYNFKVVQKRLYEVLSYKVINPFLKLYGRPPSRIKLHSEVSTNKDESCPGVFFDKAVLISMSRRFLIK